MKYKKISDKYTSDIEAAQGKFIKIVIIGQEDAREKLLKEVKEKPILMGEQTVGNSVSEKYLGDMNSQHGTARSITETIHKRLS